MRLGKLAFLLLVHAVVLWGGPISADDDLSGVILLRKDAASFIGTMLVPALADTPLRKSVETDNKVSIENLKDNFILELFSYNSAIKTAHDTFVLTDRDNISVGRPKLKAYKVVNTRISYRLHYRDTKNSKVTFLTSGAVATSASEVKEKVFRRIDTRELMKEADGLCMPRVDRDIQTKLVHKVIADKYPIDSAYKAKRIQQTADGVGVEIKLKNTLPTRVMGRLRMDSRDDIKHEQFPLSKDSTSKEKVPDYYFCPFDLDPDQEETIRFLIPQDDVLKVQENWSSKSQFPYIHIEELKVMIPGP